MRRLAGSVVIVAIAASTFTIMGFADGVQTPSAKVFFSGVGSLAQLAFLDLRGLNVALPGTEFTGDLDLDGKRAFLMQGGLVFGAGDLRLGGVNVKGCWTASASGPFDRAELRLSYGGVLFEVLLNPTSRLPLFAGGIIGSGRLSLLLSKGAEGAFDDLIQRPLLLQLSRSYLILQPYLSTEFKLLDLGGLKLEVGLLFAASSREWQLPDRTKAKDGPLKLFTALLIGVALILGG